MGKSAAAIVLLIFSFLFILSEGAKSPQVRRKEIADRYRRNGLCFFLKKCKGAQFDFDIDSDLTTARESSTGSTLSPIERHRQLYRQAAEARRRTFSSNSNSSDNLSGQAKIFRAHGVSVARAEPEPPSTLTITVKTQNPSSTEVSASKPEKPRRKPANRRNKTNGKKSEQSSTESRSRTRTDIAQHIQEFKELSKSKEETIEHLPGEVEESGEMCNTCPKLIMFNEYDMRVMCANIENVMQNFAMNMDKPISTSDKEESIHCTKNLKCSEPYAIVRWPEFPICDIYSLTAPETEFAFKCNGTDWSLHGFPVEAVGCATKLTGNQI